MKDVRTRPARRDDVPGITACVCAAYLPCIARFGYVQYDHRVVNGYPRLFFRKRFA